MANFEFSNVLPDPQYGIDSAGLDYNYKINTANELVGKLGQPFAQVKLASIMPTESDKTINGRLISRVKAYHKWDIQISYNPMTKEDFSPVYRFLMQRRGSLKPFEVILPQHRRPQNTQFATNVTDVARVVATNGPMLRGASNIDVSYSLWTVADDYSAGLPTPGDIFTVLDDVDSLHTKTYMVTRVETTLDYKDKPADTEIRLHFTPGLQREITSDTFLEFSDPKIQVVQKQNTQEYDLNTEDLYSFSIRLEEAFY